MNHATLIEWASKLQAEANDRGESIDFARTTQHAIKSAAWLVKSERTRHALLNIAYAVNYPPRVAC